MQGHGRRRIVGRAAGAALVWLSAASALPLQAQTLPDRFFPESIAAAADGRLFVGSHTQSRIVQVAPGATVAQPFVAEGANGLMSVQGLLADDARGLLWACTADLGASPAPKGPSALLAFELDSGAAAGRWPLPDGGFCNDIAFGPSGQLLITDTTQPRILGFDPQARRLFTWLAHPLLGGQPFNGNGITVDRDNVFVSTFADGRLLRIPVGQDGRPGTPAAVALPRPLRGGDALRTVGPDRILVFENGLPQGGGQVTLALIEDDRAMLAPVASGIDEPTSGVLRGGRLLVVGSQFARLYGQRHGEAAAPFALLSLDVAAMPSALPLPTGPAYPNGIAVAADGTVFTGFVASGLILRQRPGDGWTTLSAGTDTVYAATSLRLDAPRQLLWGTSPDFLADGRAPRPHRLFALDAATGASRRVIDLPAGAFGNDVAVAPDGTVLLTDSFQGRVWRLPPGARHLEPGPAHADLEPPPGGSIGVAGIARAPDGRLVLANYGSGRLLVAERDGTVRPLPLPRKLANPDGLALAPDGALLVCEGDVEGGNGRVLRIADPFAASTRHIDVLAEGLASPVNLSLAPDGTLLVTEARIRHRLAKAAALPVPTSFRIIRLPLPRDAARRQR